MGRINRWMKILCKCVREWVTVWHWHMKHVLLFLSTLQLRYFLKSSFLGWMSALTHPLSSLTHEKSWNRERQRKGGKKRQRSLIERELICSGLDGFACLHVIAVRSLSISAPGNYWLVLFGKLLISCSLALFNYTHPIPFIKQMCFPCLSLLH